MDAKTAANFALKYLREITTRVLRLAVEEVELSSDGKYWYITLSYSESLSTAIPPKYKVFKIDNLSGKVLSMKIRTL